MFCLNSYFTATTPLFCCPTSCLLLTRPLTKNSFIQQWIFNQIPILSDLPDTPNWISSFAFFFMAMVNFLSSFYVLLSLFSLSVKILTDSPGFLLFTPFWFDLENRISSQSSEIIRRSSKLLKSFFQEENQNRKFYLFKNSKIFFFKEFHFHRFDANW